MAQLGLRYPEIQALDAEVLQVTHNTLDEARGYLKHYPMKFPYLCDAERTAHDKYGVAMLGMNIGGFLASSAAVVVDLVTKGETTPPPIPYFKRYAGKDTEQAVFVLDREGVVRAEHRLGPNAPLPSAEDLISALQKL
jgi:peroxiredoxin